MFCEPKGQELNTIVCSIFLEIFLNPWEPLACVYVDLKKNSSGCVQIQSDTFTQRDTIPFQMHKKVQNYTKKLLFKCYYAVLYLRLGFILYSKCRPALFQIATLCFSGFSNPRTLIKPMLYYAYFRAYACFGTSQRQ